MFDYCLFVRNKYVADCIKLAEDWIVAIDSAGVECKKGKTDSNDKCWGLKRKSDKVEVTSPDGSETAEHFSFEKARLDLLPRPKFNKDVYNFENMETEFNKSDFSETCDVFLALRDGEDKTIKQPITKPCDIPGYDDCE